LHQIRAAEVKEMPNSAPSSRADQWVTPAAPAGGLTGQGCHHDVDLVDLHRSPGTWQIAQRGDPTVLVTAPPLTTVGRLGVSCGS